MKISELLEATVESDEKEPGVPAVLYHGTFKPYIKSIKKYGLGGGNYDKNYKDSKDGVIYLTTNIHDAVSYTEASETIPNDFLGKVVVLKIQTDMLDPAKIFKDPIKVAGLGTIYEYHGVIQAEALSYESKRHH